MSFTNIIENKEKEVLNHLEKGGFDVGIGADKLQRTDEWFKQRLGRFTGSGIKNLMSTSRSTSKMEWGREEKIIDFSQTAIKYLYEKAMERKRQKVIHLQTSAAMRYGTENEDITVELFLSKNPNLEFKEVGFIEFIKGIAGASPDGLLTDKITDKKYGYEGKCAVGWDTVFSRMETPFEQKHQDFWQIQTEMMALKVESLYYCVAEPSEDMFDANITDVQFKEVKASKIHQESIRHRCMIGNNAIELFLTGSDINLATQKACTNYEGFR